MEILDTILKWFTSGDERGGVGLLRLVQIVSALATIFVAYLGLNTWRRQLKADTLFKNAFSIIRAAETLMKSILDPRIDKSPLVYYQTDPKVNAAFLDQHRARVDQEIAYHNEVIEAVEDANENFQESISGNALLFGEVIRAETDELNRARETYTQTIRTRIEFLRQIQVASMVGLESVPAILYRSELPESTKFEEELRRNVTRLQRKLQKHIPR
jgi:hypothetical protein